MSVSDEEKEALLGAFEALHDETKTNRSLKKIITVPYIYLMVTFVCLLTYTQIFRVEVVQHYTLIHDLSLYESDMLIRVKGLIGLLGVGLFTLSFCLERGLAVTGLILLTVLIHGFFDDVTARMVTPGAMQDLTMNGIMLLRLALIATLARITQICLRHVKSRNCDI